MKPLLRPIYYFIPKSPWRRYSHTQSEVAATANELLTILERVEGMEHSLESLVSLISKNKMASLIPELAKPQLAFRFFIWATKRLRLCSQMYQTTVIDMLVKDDAFELYWRTLEEFRECGIPIGSDAFSVLIKGYDKLGIAEKAVEAFGRMKDFDCKPNVNTYNAILYIMVRKEVFLLALAVYNQMLKSNRSPNRNTYSILMNGLCKTRKTKDALRMFDEMIQRGFAPSTRIYTIIVSGLCQAKRVHEAHRLVDTMKESGCTPDVITYHALLDGYCKLGRLDEAYSLVRSFERDGYVLELEGYSSLIFGLFSARRFGEAHGLYSKMINNGIEPDVILCTIMIKGTKPSDKLVVV